MHIHRDIAALRSDFPAQRRLQAAFKRASDAWHLSEPVAEFRRALAGYADDGVLANHPTLANLVGNHAAAQGFADDFIVRFVAALRAEPLGEVPFGHSTGAGFSRMQLLNCDGATLSICAFEKRPEADPPQAVRFVDCETHEIILAGSAQGALYRRLGTLTCEDREWRAGDVISCQAMTGSRHFQKVDTTLLVLQLTRKPVRPAPSIELRLTDGALLREVSGDKCASEQVMALCVLGALGSDPAPLVQFARDTGHDREARWEALRQVLSIDSARGFALLCEIAGEQADTLARPAADLRAKLAADHPQLRLLAEAF